MNNTFLKINLFLFCLGTLFIPILSKSLLQNSIHVSAEGKYEAEPDTALMQFALSVKEKTPQLAYDHAERSAQQLRDLLQKNGIDSKRAELSTFQIQPTYEYKNGKSYLVGYTVYSNIALKLNDFSKVDALIQGLKDIDISDTQSLHYILDGIDSAKQKAVQDGYRRARILAETIATAGDKVIDEMIYASVDALEQHHTAMPLFRTAKMATAEQSIPETFGQQKITITAQVTVVFGLK
jgi:uncharacterized protein